jgi:hypothetical protein
VLREVGELCDVHYRDTRIVSFLYLSLELGIQTDCGTHLCDSENLLTAFLLRVG